MKNRTVSVIIVVQNGERYVASAIESIQNQTYKASEIIVVDGRSTDNTSKIVARYSQVRLIQQQGYGLADARNTGINAAQGDFIAFLDSDDIWTPDKLEIQIHCLIQNSHIQYTTAMAKLFLEPGHSIRPGFPPKLLEKSQIARTPGTLVARRILFNQIGKFNSNFKIGCDVDWFSRAKDHEVPMAFISKTLLYKRIHDSNVSRHANLNRQELLQIIRQSIDRRRQHNLT
jgi:glycosyltransferase involved in cell wall biosynthesis